MSCGFPAWWMMSGVENAWRGVPDRSIGTERGAFQGPYCRAKQGQEDVAFEVREAGGLEVTIVRPSNVYGAGSGPWVEGMTALIRADLLAVLGDGSGNAGLVHV